MWMNFLFPAKTPLWGFKVVLTRKLYIFSTLSHLAAIDQPMLRCTFVVCLRMMSLQNIWVVTIFHWVCLRIYIIVINIKVFYLLGVKLTSWNPYILKYHIIQVMNMHGQITWAQSNKVAWSYLVNLMRSSDSRHDDPSQVTNHKYTKGSCSIYRWSNVGIITANGFFQLSRPAKTIGESRNKSMGKFKLKSGARETKTETEPTSQSGDYLTTSQTNHSSRIMKRKLKLNFLFLTIKGY